MRTMCGHPIWSTEACGQCDTCNAERKAAERLFRTAQLAVAIWENLADEPGLLGGAMRQLQRALDRLPE